MQEQPRPYPVSSWNMHTGERLRQPIAQTNPNHTHAVAAQNIPSPRPGLTNRYMTGKRQLSRHSSTSISKRDADPAESSAGITHRSCRSHPSWHTTRAAANRLWSNRGRAGVGALQGGQRGQDSRQPVHPVIHDHKRRTPKARGFDEPRRGARQIISATRASALPTKHEPRPHHARCQGFNPCAPYSNARTFSVHKGWRSKASLDGPGKICPEPRLPCPRSRDARSGPRREQG